MRGKYVNEEFSDQNSPLLLTTQFFGRLIFPPATRPPTTNAAHPISLLSHTGHKTAMKASCVIFGTAALLLATTPLATADGADSPHAGRQLRKGLLSNRRKKDDIMMSGCADPVQAVLDLLECVAEQDGECAAAAYDPGFQRFHNEEFTGEIPGSRP